MRRSLLALVVCLPALAGCGGGGGSERPVSYPTDDTRGDLPLDRTAAAQAFAGVIAPDYRASNVDAPHIRRVATAPLASGGSLDILALPIPGRGGLCTVSVVATRAVGGSCALDASTARPGAFGDSSVRPIGAADGAVLLEAVLPTDAWTVAVRYEDGKTETIGMLGAWAVAVVQRSHLQAGHRPAALLARDRADATIATLDLEPATFAPAG